jgi:hypothetical protein
MKKNSESRIIRAELAACKNLWRSNSTEMSDDEKLIHMTLEFFSEKFLRLVQESEDPSMTKEQESRIEGAMNFMNRRIGAEIENLKSI